MSEPLAGSRHALIVANEAYVDATLRQLRAPSRDAEELARVLGAPGIGGFQVDQSTNEPAHLLRRRIATFFADRQLGDLLVLHLSGHGVKDEDGNLYFATSDTETDQLDATAIPAEFLNRQMARSRSKSIVLLLDCCFSGAFARGALARGSAVVGVKESFDGQGKIVLTSSNSAEYSFEGTDVEGHGDPSFFTRAVVEGLETGAADADGDQLVSVDELYDYVYDAVRRTTPNQTPCKWTFDVRGEIYLARNSAPVVATTAMLPAPILHALENPIPSVRGGVIEDLARLFAGRDRRMAEAARLALTELLQDDSRRVQQAAEAALGGSEAPEPVAEEPEPEAEVVERPPPAAAPEPEAEVAPPPPVASLDSAPVLAAPVEQRAPYRWPTLLTVGAGLGLLVALFLPIAGNDSGTMLSQPLAQPHPLHFSNLVWVDLESIGIGLVLLVLAALLPSRRLPPRFTAGFLIGVGLQSIVGGFGAGKFWVDAYGGATLSASGTVTVLAAACALTAGLLILRSQAPPEDRAEEGDRESATAGAAIALVGALIMLVGLIVPVLGSHRILTSQDNTWWAGLEIILAAGVVIAVAVRALGDGRTASLPATAIALAVGFQSTLYFLAYGFFWTTYTGLGAELGDFVGLAGALIATSGAVRMGALDEVRTRS
jgi:hypothetical protein